MKWSKGLGQLQFDHPQVLNPVLAQILLQTSLEGLQGSSSKYMLSLSPVSGSFPHTCQEGLSMFFLFKKIAFCLFILYVGGMYTCKGQRLAWTGAFSSFSSSMTWVPLMELSLTGLIAGASLPTEPSHQPQHSLPSFFFPFALSFFFLDSVSLCSSHWCLEFSM